MLPLPGAGSTFGTLSLLGKEEAHLLKWPEGPADTTPLWNNDSAALRSTDSLIDQL